MRPATREPPPPPWRPFPLAELCILIALVLGVVGVSSGDANGPVLVGGALVLCTLPRLEFTLREHLSRLPLAHALLAGPRRWIAGLAVACCLAAVPGGSSSRSRRAVPAGLLGFRDAVQAPLGRLGGVGDSGP